MTDASGGAAAAVRALIMTALFLATAIGTRYGGSALIDTAKTEIIGARQASPVAAPSQRSATTTSAPSTAATSALNAPASASPSPTPTPAPSPKPVSAESILAALRQQPLPKTAGLEGLAVSGPEEYVTPGDSVESARLLGGVVYAIDTGPQTGVFAAILMYEGPQDAQAELDGELVAAEAGGDPFIEKILAGTKVRCQSDGIVCTTTIGRAYIRVAGGVAESDAPVVEPATRAAIAALSAARAKAARNG